MSRIQVELDPDAPVTEDEDLEDDDWDDVEELDGLDELEELEFDEDDWDEDDDDLEEEHFGYVADDDGDIGVGWQRMLLSRRCRIS